MANNIAIVLAGGRGNRMNSTTPKQYLDVNGFPVLYYSLRQFQESPLINSIILVTIKEDIEYCRTEIVEKYNITKVTSIIAGGKERYESVYNGLKCVNNKQGIVYIHDGARPCINANLIERLYSDAMKYGSAIASVRTKDTIKIASEEGFVEATPNRDNVYIIQTPQVFKTEAICDAYNRMMSQNATSDITDDAMVMERFGEQEVRLTEGDYANIKLTTQEDTGLISILLKKMQKK